MRGFRARVSMFFSAFIVLGSGARLRWAPSRRGGLLCRGEAGLVAFDRFDACLARWSTAFFQIALRCGVEGPGPRIISHARRSKAKHPGRGYKVCRRE